MDVLQRLSKILGSPIVRVTAGPHGHELVVHEAVFDDTGSPSFRDQIWPWPRGQSKIDWKEYEVETVRRALTWLYIRDYPSSDPVRRDVEPQPESTLETGHVLDSRNGGQLVQERDEHTDEMVSWPGPSDEPASPEAVEAPYSQLEIPVEEPVAVAPAEEDYPPAEEPFQEDYPAEESAAYEIAAVKPSDEPPLEEAPVEVEWSTRPVEPEERVHRPLTPLGECVKIGPFKTTNKTAIGDFQERDFPHHSFSYMEVLLAHAKVYQFGKNYGLAQLQELALQRMLATLSKLDCSVKHAEEELTELVRFVYETISGDQNGREPMRKLVSQFVALNCTSLLHGSFEELLARGGEFGLDLARKLRQRLLEHEDSAAPANNHTNHLTELETLKEEPLDTFTWEGSSTQARNKSGRKKKASFSSW